MSDQRPTEARGSSSDSVSSHSSNVDPLSSRTQGESSQHESRTPCHPLRTQSAQPAQLAQPAPQTPTRRRRRKNRKKRAQNGDAAGEDCHDARFASPRAAAAGFYFQQNLSDASMDSSALLDHREQSSMRPRRSSTAPVFDTPRTPRRATHSHHYQPQRTPYAGADDDVDADEHTSLLPPPQRPATSGNVHRRVPYSDTPTTTRAAAIGSVYGSVNFPPSVPSSPHLGATHLDDYSALRNADRDTIIQIGTDAADDDMYPSSSHSSMHHDHPMRQSGHRAEEDVCFPVDDGLMDEDEDEDASNLHDHGGYPTGRPRRRGWPDMAVLEEWSREEKEERSEGIRAKKLPEPVYVGGRLRPPVRPQWHMDEDEMPYRFTYFNDELPATIHSHTISELLQPGQSFSDLFRPEPRILEDSSSEEEPEPPLGAPRTSRTGSNIAERSSITPPEPSQSLPRLGPRPTFWLDVFKTTDAEMKVISKAFGIHPLTTEDIMMQEAREKVELFRSYYLVSYRTFEQDSNSEDYMDPVNIYVVVFRDGVISVRTAPLPRASD